MKSIKSFTTPIFAFILVIVTLFFPSISAFWVGPLLSVTIEIVLVFLGVFILLTTIGILLIPKYLGASILKMETHVIFQAFETRDRFTLLCVFPLTMVFEEALFRGFIAIGLSYIVSLGQWGAIFLSSAIFSTYHLHTWPTFKDIRITTCFMVFSFALGIACGYFVFTLGIIAVILLHWFSVFLIYYDLRTKMKHFQRPS
ncbi:MAG TPA: CPBP family glutamic-type intramembrane protease [Candidatus Lokiarchaeia archaeon]|nr:CPBP family glutamic-type intramembrane protease [Candidatus Lokiarchaeia archaeon]